MCGIFGFTHNNSSDLNLDAARKALHTLTHRGPDQWDDFHDARTYLGHRRLSIMDLSDNGRQPMQSDNTILTANGEIWNFQGLRQKLAAKTTFKSDSDCEVLLHGYNQWGMKKLLQQIDGMFAFTIYDTQKQKLYIVRDRYGIKPLYYSLNDNQLSYASEAKALMEHNVDLRCFSKIGVQYWMTYRGGQSPLTIYHNILKLLPGTYLEYDLKTSRHKIHTYYDIMNYAGGTPSTPQDLDLYLNQAVDKRLMSDVPVGLQLSGGVDSSLIGHYMHEKTQGLNSFSVGFSESENAHLSEEKYARQAAQQLDCTHHQLNVTKHDACNQFNHVLWLCDGMLDFPNTIPIYMLSKYAKPIVTVQLTGEGADELFGGYRKFKTMADLAHSKGLSSIIPDIFASLVAQHIKPRLGRALYLKKHYGGAHKDILNGLNCYITPQTSKALFKGAETPDLLDDTTQKRMSDMPFERQLLLADHKTYLNAVLERQDKGSMGASIESRVPFLDRNLIEWAVNLPLDQLYDKNENKKLVKKLAAQYFPRDFIYRKKIGFPLPVERWMHDPDALQSKTDAIHDKDFILNDVIDLSFLKNALHKNQFDYKLLNYVNRERDWITWFLLVLRQTQKTFNITNIQ